MHIIRIFSGTFAVEGIGAILYGFRFIPKYGVAKGVWYSVFHAISAFCNAGIDLLGDSSFMAYKGDVLINITTMFLIVVGGMGFIVWWDILKNINNIRNKKIGVSRRILRWCGRRESNPHTKKVTEPKSVETASTTTHAR